MAVAGHQREPPRWECSPPLRPASEAFFLSCATFPSLTGMAAARASTAVMGMLATFAARLTSTLRVVCEVTALVRGCRHLTLQLAGIDPNHRNRRTRIDFRNARYLGQLLFVCQ